MQFASQMKWEWILMVLFSAQFPYCLLLHTILSTKCNEIFRPEIFLFFSFANSPHFLPIITILCRYKFRIRSILFSYFSSRSGKKQQRTCAKSNWFEIECWACRITLEMPLAITKKHVVISWVAKWLLIAHGSGKYKCVSLLYYCKMPTSIHMSRHECTMNPSPFLRLSLCFVSFLSYSFFFSDCTSYYMQTLDFVVYTAINMVINWAVEA